MPASFQAHIKPDIRSVPDLHWQSGKRDVHEGHHSKAPHTRKGLVGRHNERPAIEPALLQAATSDPLEQCCFNVHVEGLNHKGIFIDANVDIDDTDTEVVLLLLLDDLLVHRVWRRGIEWFFGDRRTRKLYKNQKENPDQLIFVKWLINKSRR